MRRVLLVMMVMAAASGHAGQQLIRGSVTYLGGGTVYTSLGRDAGVRDSSSLYVILNNDTTAVLSVFAVSSKSSACRIVRSSRPVMVGDVVVGIREVGDPGKTVPDSTVEQTRSEVSSLPAGPARQAREQKELLEVQGRISAQYFTSLYDNTAYNIMQPGIVLNLRGALRDAPLRFDLYANLRSLSLGNQGPFSHHAVNQSRIYGLSVSYDDGRNVVSLGRIIPVFAPSIGYIDGVLASTGVGNVVFGTTLGYQPDYTLRSLATDFRKVAFFVQYATPDRMSLSVSAAYARTYFHSALDREAASMLVNAALGTNLYLYANAEIDMRKKSGTDFVLSPALTSAYVNLNYRVTRAFSAGLGADASRPYYSFEAVRLVPDSLLATDLRSGVSIFFSWNLPGGMTLYNTFTPRNSRDAAFGSEYSNYSSISFVNVLSTGINLRSNMTMNANLYTRGTGYGASVQKTFAGLVDVNFRYQRSGYTVKQTDLRNTSTTIGADVMIFLSRSLSFMTTFDRLEGFGTVSHSVFAELSVRF